ncbi:hypothetical protein CVT25_012919 [Psilocybe cyanescens]|uniref:Uncharacterized protein n=1 Tax=Psilocybe cyanescens TaxID=93625 RepID=A0A409XLX8_PSICY|nr:hypothetical protein CVT25_012919 [Psilocybe cyanescens]
MAEIAVILSTSQLEETFALGLDNHVVFPRANYTVRLYVFHCSVLLPEPNAQSFGSPTRSIGHNLCIVFAYNVCSKPKVTTNASQNRLNSREVFHGQGFYEEDLITYRTRSSFSASEPRVSSGFIFVVHGSKVATKAEDTRSTYIESRVDKVVYHDGIEETDMSWLGLYH